MSSALLLYAVLGKL